MSAFKKLRKRRARYNETNVVPSTITKKRKKWPRSLRRWLRLRLPRPSSALTGEVSGTACFRMLLPVRLAVLLVVIVLFVPWMGVTLWPYLYGLIGDLSVSTWLVFLCWFVWPKLFYRWLAQELPLRRRCCLFLAMALFYGLVLGNGSIDPYAYGYQPWPILVALTLWVAWQGRAAPGITLILAISLAAFSLHVLPSSNLWDSLFDPVLALLLGISAIRGVISRRFSS